MTSAPLSVSPVPGPRGLPLLGNLRAFGRDPLDFFVGLREEYGDWVTWSLGPKRCMLVSHPDLIAEVIGGVEQDYDIRPISWSFKQIAGDSALMSRGEDWRRKRGLVQPAVRPRQVRAYAANMVECSSALADRWRDGQRIDVHREMTELTQRIIVRTLFGNDLGPGTRALGEAMAVAQKEISVEARGIGLHLPSWARTPGRRRLLRAAAILDAEVNRLISARRRDVRRTAGGEDLLDRLLAARDDQGRRLTAKEVRDEAMTLWIAGHETTSITLTWIWYLLSTSPESSARLTEELKRVLGGRPPAAEDYDRLTWTQCVVKEALRLYPPVWSLIATARPGATLGGRAIRAETLVWCSQWSTQRDPRWFPAPTAFRPERWAADAPVAVPDHVWFPFGGGRRACLGARFALVEAALIVATLAQRFTPACPPDAPALLTGLLMQPAEPLYATLRGANGTP
ncbi:cytochrome P450 [Streptomyces aureoverticillatus]|uniref:cytochrome P450 n=1 Tax=Streptomyces aureoverticillatus TaxID=66871 RepID=UPI0013DA1241|nr:cytochrome P450 [Streptomyces aureoverticillatus]QIB42679.1 cytochrome P450 [Streptomyces aureoverticillatus]